MTPDPSSLDEVPFDAPAAAKVETNGAHESYETAKPVKKPVGTIGRVTAPIVSPEEAMTAVRRGLAAAEEMASSQASTRIQASVGRSLPHSLEAEEYLISACLMDGQEVMPKCLDAKISDSSFYEPRHGIIFALILALFRAKKAISVEIIAEELKTAKKLDQVGGYAFLMQVSDRLPTTAQASYFIEKVREQATLREIIRAATSAVEECHGFSGGIDDFGIDIRRRMEFAIGGASGTTSHAMDWDELLAFDPKHDPDCLMGNRFLGRTGGLVIVAPSGVGKSVLGFQLGACAALQRVFFSLRMIVPMRVLYIQAEDDFGDVAEAVQGFASGSGLTADDLAKLKANLRIERWNHVSGEKFLVKLRRFHAVWPFDLVIINPLFAFAGCNISEQKELSPFLRNGLNPILNDTRSAAIIIHHTNKPPQDPGAQDKAMDAELRYLGSGSAELTNWARAYITLQGVRSAGDHVHKMVFVKRGNRAGLVDDDGKPTHSIYIEHSKQGLCWMPSDYRTEASGGKFVNRFNMDKALAVYDSEKHWTENEILIARDQNLTPRAVRNHRAEIESRG